eukprot:TRINITY_DN7753_c0_g1_i2.p1 TRINITY_DN7753_c0_g1~~TRINITY_DN7753_c0_g1_i2.p1  ORF type:complete len:244 (-),score=31.87 TRINITY_DN7753_c0_g1_i2:73-732(-)
MALFDAALFAFSVFIALTCQGCMKSGSESASESASEESASESKPRPSKSYDMRSDAACDAWLTKILTSELSEGVKAWSPSANTAMSDLVEVRPPLCLALKKELEEWARAEAIARNPELKDAEPSDERYKELKKKEEEILDRARASAADLSSMKKVMEMVWQIGYAMCKPGTMGEAHWKALKCSFIDKHAEEIVGSGCMKAYCDICDRVEGSQGPNTDAF